MDPFTIAMAAMALGKLFKGGMALLGGNQAKKAAEMAADQSRREAGVEAGIALDQGERVSADAAVAAGHDGGGLNGSVLNLLEDYGRQSMHNARSAIYRGEAEGRRLEYEGRVKQAEGRQAMVSSVFDAASSFLGGTAEAAQAKKAAGAAAASRSTSYGAPSGGYGMQDRV